MRKLVLYGFPYVLKAVLGVAAVVLAVMAFMAFQHPMHAAYYALMAVMLGVASWICPTLGRPMSAQEVWDRCPVDDRLAQDTSPQEIEQMLRRRVAKALLTGNMDEARNLAETHRLWKEQGGPSLSGVRAVRNEVSNLE